MESVNGGGNGVGSLPGLRTGSPASIDTAPPIGEIVDTSVADFTSHACQLNVAPPFGGFVKVTVPERTVYAIVYAIHTGGLEPGSRPVLRGRDGMRDEAIFDQNPDLEQLLRTEFSALIIGYQEGASLRTYLPPSPPPSALVRYGM